jgi:hypothetical protein
LPTGIKTFFFVVLFCSLCTIIDRCIILCTFLYKKFSIQGLLESKPIHKATLPCVKPTALWKESRHHVQVYSDLNLYASPVRSVGSVLVHNINNFLSKDSVDVSLFGFSFRFLFTIITYNT